MLNGIGGRTIAEAKEKISADEFGRWVEYRKQFGPLNGPWRAERDAAMLAALYHNSKVKQGNELPWYRFAPHHEEPEITVEQAMEIWR